MSGRSLCHGNTAALKPYDFPDAGTGRGRRPIGLERMLRMCCLQQGYALADEALEDTIYDSQALRNFVGIDLGKESEPDATALLGFRHWLEANGLTKTIFETVNRHLRARAAVAPGHPGRTAFDCLPSAQVGQKGLIEEERVSGPS
jgi:IS5 family transposase